MAVNRANPRWGNVQPKEGVWNWEIPDRILESRAKYGMDVQWLVSYSPRWSRVDPEIHTPRIEPWRRFLCVMARLRRLAGLGLTHRLLYADVRVDRFRLHAAYRPQPISTPTVIFNAIEPETDAAATWRPFFEGPLAVHDTTDPHLGQATIDEAREVILRHLSDLGET
jgi:hypothetical protein